MNCKIKRFKEFEMISEDKNGSIYEYGCLMLYVSLPIFNSLVNSIEKNDLYEPDNQRYGVETEPHITILYGIHKNVDDDQIRSLFSDFKKKDFDLKVNGIDCFNNDNFDVLKLNVSSEKLNDLNKLANMLDHTTEFPDYKPHLTVAYLLNGKGKKYVDPTFKMNIDKIDKIVYSKTNGEKIDIFLS